MLVLKGYITREKPSKLFFVGDFVTRQAVEKGIQADVYVIDNKIMRNPVNTTLPKGIKVVCIQNPSGTITAEAWERLKEIMKCESPIGICVEGEEDLLTLPLIKFAPLDAFVVYGQPFVGIVLVRVTPRKQREIETILVRMS